jgi:2-succinyl-5-enolpyruvyl-6-hydroxy-3-cyclohexene-1-carboxylate synthase
VKGGDLNAHWARTFLDELARSGVQEICVSPGSRSTPLVLAAASDPRFRVTSVVDERSAGFLALGMGKASGVPAAVITTSGTAGANLYPAVIEASQGEIPLLVLTADRPHRLRDTDGNQAIDQIHLFGGFPRMFVEVAPPGLADGDLKHLRAQACRAVAQAQGSPPGPVHLNFPFEKPLEPSDPEPSASPPPEGVSQLAWEGRAGGEPFVRIPRTAPQATDAEVARLLEALSASSRGVIVAGPHPEARKVGPAVLALSAATGFPVLADPLSGARFSHPHGAQVVAGYDLFLRSPSVRAALAPDLILRVGASPTSASLLQYLGDHSGAIQLVVDDGHRWKDHLASAHLYLRADPASLLYRISTELHSGGREDWVTLWKKAESKTREQLEAETPATMLEGEVLARVVDALPQGANLLVGNSMPIREMDAFAHPQPKPLCVYGNRGTSGIDGMVSTTLGIGYVSQGMTVGVLGDLAFFHDMNGLLTLKTEKFPVGFVVVNNDGGGIFHTLPVRFHGDAFTRFFTTPHGLDFEYVARLYELPFGRVESREELPGALAAFLEKGEPFILEVRSSRAEGHEGRRKRIESMVAAFEEDELV